jgi:hypothetical protein
VPPSRHSSRSSYSRTLRRWPIAAQNEAASARDGDQLLLVIATPCAASRWHCSIWSTAISYRRGLPVAPRSVFCLGERALQSGKQTQTAAIPVQRLQIVTSLAAEQKLSDTIERFCSTDHCRRRSPRVITSICCLRALIRPVRHYVASATALDMSARFDDVHVMFYPSRRTHGAALPRVRGRPFAQPGQSYADVRSRRRKRLRALAVAADGWQAFEQVPFIPIGQWFHPTAFRNIVTDVGRQGTHADPPPAGMARSSLRLSNGG